MPEYKVSWSVTMSGETVLEASDEETAENYVKYSYDMSDITMDCDDIFLEVKQVKEVEESS